MSNKKEIKYWLKAKQKAVNSLFNLGFMYENGYGVPQDDESAVKWYTLAAGQGHASAQTNLAWMYENGRGVPKAEAH